MAVTVVAIGLTAWVAPTREQRAIANLVKSGADISLFHTPDGAGFFDVRLDVHGDDGPVMLSYLLDIDSVRRLYLGGSVSEAGVKCLLRLRGLRYLKADHAEFPPDVYPQLERDLKRNNPNMEIGGRRVIELK
jgi:hypothetical protein